MWKVAAVGDHLPEDAEDEGRWGDDGGAKSATRLDGADEGSQPEGIGANVGDAGGIEQQAADANDVVVPVFGREIDPEDEVVEAELDAAAVVEELVGHWLTFGEEGRGRR